MPDKKPMPANPPAPRNVKDAALKDRTNLDRQPSDGYIDAILKRLGRPVALVDGVLNRATYRAIVAEAKAKGLNTRKVTIYSTLAAYSGPGIDTILYRDVAGFDAGGKLENPELASPASAE